jgi:hypothetical protein
MRPRSTASRRVAAALLGRAVASGREHSRDSGRACRCRNLQYARVVTLQGVVLQAARLGQQKLRRIVPLLAALPVRTSHYSSNHHSPAGLVLNNTPGQKKDVIEIHVLAITAALSMRTRLKNTTPPFREGHCMRGAAGAINRRAYPIFLLPSTT